MTLETRVKRIESALGGQSDYIGFQELLVATLTGDPAEKARATARMAGREVEPSLAALLQEVLDAPQATP